MPLKIFYCWWLPVFSAQEMFVRVEKVTGRIIHVSLAYIVHIQSEQLVVKETSVVVSNQVLGPSLYAPNVAPLLVINISYTPWE